MNYLWVGTGLVWLLWIVLYMTTGGTCERPKLVKDFDPDRYVGRWYEIYRSYTVGFETEDCATATYVKLPGNYI